jgi:hypothetical protein
MPSPFPGMDPYLEGSMNFHHQFSAEIARQLSGSQQFLSDFASLREI